MDIILPQAQLDCDLWDCRIDDLVPLYILAARRGAHFINVAFRLLEYLNKHNSMSSRVIQLIEDDATDDYTVCRKWSFVHECMILIMPVGSKYSE